MTAANSQFSDDGQVWPGALRSVGYVKLTVATTPPFITPRGDVVSSSHVGTTVLRGGGSTACGVWQEAKGIYNVCFDQVLGAPIKINPVGGVVELASGSQNPFSGTVGGYNNSNTAPDVFGNLPSNYVAGSSGSITTAINALNDGGVTYHVMNAGGFTTGSNPFAAQGNVGSIWTFCLLQNSSGSFSLTDPVTNDIFIPFDFYYTASDGTW